MISIVACCRGAKLCAHAARDFRSKQNGAVTKMWRTCRVQPSHKKNVRSVWFVVKRRGCCCNLSGGVALTVWFTMNGMCAKNKNVYAWCEQAVVREIATHDLYCCLLPRCKALRTCCSGFPIATGLTNKLLLDSLWYWNRVVSGLIVFSCFGWVTVGFRWWWGWLSLDSFRVSQAIPLQVCVLRLILDLMEEVKETLFDLRPDERTEKGKHIIWCQLSNEF